MAGLASGMQVHDLSARRIPAPALRAALANDAQDNQGSLTNLSFPAGFSVLASKVRISVTPPISSVTTSRSPATAVETMRAPLGSVAMMSVAGCRGASLAAVKTVPDGDQDHGHRQRRGQARDQHHPPHPRQQRGLLGGRFGRNGIGHARLS